jgi:spore coat protein CotH
LLVNGIRVSGESTSAELFNDRMLQRVDINLHTQDWAKLKQDFRSNEYYPADFVWNGETARNIAIRSRGVGSRSGTKPALKVDFNQYDSDYRFLGLRGVVLDNLLQDPSGVHESVSMWLFNKLNIPAPRESHARLYVNGEYEGLYVLTEPIDKDFLARVYGSNGGDVLNDGYLYEYNKVGVWNFTYLGSELDAYKPYFDPKTHETKPDEELYRPIETLVRLANERIATDLPEAIGGLLDLREFVRYVAVQNFLAEQDGFLGEFGVNNFYLYRLEHSDQHVLIPWDDDLTFITPDLDIRTRWEANPLFSKLMELSEYRGLYMSTLQEAVDASDAREPGEEIGALEAEIRRQLDLIIAPMAEDTHRPWSDAEVATYTDLMKQFAKARIRFVACQVADLTGGPRC